jgi:hypothetical protein
MANWMNTGMSKAQVRKARVNLTFDGAGILNACGGAQERWAQRNQGRALRLTLAVIKDFEGYGIGSFIERVYLYVCKNVPYASPTYQQAMDMCNETGAWAWHPGESESKIRAETLVRLKAAIIFVCKLKREALLE